MLAICPEQASVRKSAYLLQQAGPGIVPYQINEYFTNVYAACFDLACLTFELLPLAHELSSIDGFLFRLCFVSAVGSASVS